MNGTLNIIPGMSRQPCLALPADGALVENMVASAVLSLEYGHLPLSVGIAAPQKGNKRGGVLGVKRGKYGKDSRVTKWRQRV